MIRGSRARIGFLWPVDGLNDDEYWDSLPDGVAWLTARYTAGQESEDLNADNLAAYADPALLARSARLLVATKPHAIACGDHAASFIAGREKEQAICRAVQDMTGVAATMPSASIVAALQCLGVSHIALAAPYSAAITETFRRYLEAAGFAVLRVHAEGHVSEEAIGPAGPEASFHAALAADQPLAEAIVLAGGGIRAGAILDALEARIGKPVIAAPRL